MSPVAILCGGKGTRMQSGGARVPKPLVEIGGRPILWHVMSLYAAQGLKHFVLLLGHGAEQMESRALDAIGTDDVLEREPLESLASTGELFAYRHEGFWDCMDTYKDTLLLNELWERGEAPWRALVGA